MPRPESGRDCLISAKFARQPRRTLAALLYKVTHLSEYGTHKTVKARFWPWTSGKRRLYHSAKPTPCLGSVHPRERGEWEADALARGPRREARVSLSLFITLKPRLKVSLPYTIRFKVNLPYTIITIWPHMVQIWSRNTLNRQF